MTDSVRDRRPESVLVLVYTGKGDVLLVQRADTAEFWQSITGGLEHEESAIAAARRELKEETGICPEQHGAELIDHQRSSLFEISGVWRKRYSPEHTHNREHIFSVQLLEPVKPDLNEHEHIDFVWLPAEQAKERATSPTNKRAIEEIVQKPMAR